MARIRRKITRKKKKTVLPDWFPQYVLLVSLMETSGLRAQVDSILRLNRGSGYAGLDLVMFLLAYFASGLCCSLKDFDEECRDFRSELAAVMDRKKFPSQSSMSRGLGVVASEQAETLSDEALGKCSDAPHLVDHEGAVYRDTRGEKWHAFHWDPTVKTLRHRALPESDELAAAIRRSKELAQPGYSGRKRGDVQFSRAMLVHSGIGLWTHARQRPGNSKTALDLRDATVSLEEWGERNDVPPEGCIVCSDGADGGWPQLEVGCTHCPRFVTRLSAYNILDAPDVAERLDVACWREVDDSGSGPRRYATELGVLSQAESSEVRLVVSRFQPRDGRKRGAGVVIDGWQYEIFATDVPVAAFPASEVVTVYYGRCGQENRFAQEDRQLNLDRIFSYHAPGQFLASVIGLWVWNQRIICGAELETPLEEPSYEPTPRATIEAEVSHSSTEQSELHWVELDTNSTLVSADRTVAELSEDEPISDAEPDVQQHHDADLQSPLPPEHVFGETPSQPTEPPVAVVPVPSTSPETDDGLPDKTQDMLMDALHWPARYSSSVGWSWDPEQRELRCPGDVVLPYHGTRVAPGGQQRIRFRAPASTCSDCCLRSKCSSSRAPRFRKEVSIPVREASHFAQNPVGQDSANGQSMWVGRFLLQPPFDASSTSGPFEIRHPMLVPIEFHRTVGRVCRETQVNIKLTNPPRKRRFPSYIALTPAERQHRRKTWAQRLGWNQLPTAAEVTIEISGPPSITQLGWNDDEEALAA